MEKSFVEVLTELWSELPRWAGHGWGDLEPGLEALLTRYARAADRAERARIIVEMEDLLNEQAPDALAKIDDMVTGKEAKEAWVLRGLAGDPIQPPPRPSLHCPATDPPHELDWTDIDYSDPDRLTCRRHPGTELVRV